MSDSSDNSRTAHPANRAAWLQEKRRLTEFRYDTVFSRDYDQQYGFIDPTHRRYLEKVLSLTPPGSTILDAACGTGKYWQLILQSGRRVVGIDQSAEMLRLAKAKHPEVPTEKMALQDMSFEREFPAVICVDTMENVSPEDWPPVLANFHRALMIGGYLYITVELLSEDEIKRAYQLGREMGLPLVVGEYAHHGGYHYYPTDKQVKEWLSRAGFFILDSGTGDGYLHYLCRSDAG